MNVIILAKFSTNLQKLSSGYKINGKMKYSFFFFSACWWQFFSAKNFYNLIDYALERNRYVIMCVWHASMPQSNIQFWREKSRFFPLRMKSPKRNTLQCYSIEHFFSKLQTAFFLLLNRKFAMSYTHNIRCWLWEVKETKNLQPWWDKPTHKAYYCEIPRKTFQILR